MTKAEQKLHSQAEKLRDQLAAAQAQVDAVRTKLNRIEGKIAGDPPIETGLDLLWTEAPPMARTRSSKYKCRVAWNRIPAGQRPRVVEVISALKAWKRCFEWKKDDGQFIPALDRWIRERRWESLPEDVSASSRYRSKPKAIESPEDAVTDRAEIARLLSQRVNS